jgi:dihydrofolate reductase
MLTWGSLYEKLYSNQKVICIVAYDEKRAIGSTNKIPWNLPDDRKFFKETTMGWPVIMGRKTWESLPKKVRPLPDRTNIVLSREFLSPIPSKYQNLEISDFFNGAFVLGDIKDALEMGFFYNFMGKKEQNNVFIIGGAQIYRAYFDAGLVDEVIATEVFGDFGGDVFFPKMPPYMEKCNLVRETDKFKIIHYKKEKERGADHEENAQNKVVEVGRGHL